MESEKEKMECDESNSGEKEKGGPTEESMSDDDSSSSDEEEDRKRTEVLSRIEDIEKKLKEDPFKYFLHKERIDMLRDITELEKLRKAREEMNKVYPLTPDLWLNWIQDEMKVACTDKERQYVTQLFERGVKEYLSIELWLEYVQHSIGNLGTLGVDSVRQVFENALAAGGLHAAKGGLLWDAYREFENVLLTNTEPNTEAYNKQRSRILNIFLRQLAEPLLDMENSYREFESWLTEEEAKKPEVIEGKNVYQQSLQLMQSLKYLENVLISLQIPSKEGLEAYKDYIEVEKSGGNFARVCCLYERCVAAFPLEVSLWQDYTRYLHQVNAPQDLCFCISERSVRNCPWDGKIWVEHLETLEKLDYGVEKVKSTMERGLNFEFCAAVHLRTLWIGYLSYLKRRIDWSKIDEKLVEEFRESAFKAIEHVHNVFGDKGDPGCDILLLWAHVEGALCKNMEKCRQLWNDVLQHPNNSNTFMWLQYANFEQAYGDVKHCRRVFARALNQTSDWPEGVATAWLRFERVHGTLLSFKNTQIKIDDKLRKVQEEKRRKREEKQKKVKQKGRVKSNKQEKLPEQPSAKKRKIDESPTHTDSDGFKVPPIPVPPKKVAADESVKPSEESVKPDLSKNDRTVFLSNLDYNCEEEDIKAVFSSVGTVSDLRLVRDFKGRSKGYGYMEFSTLEEVEAALKKDRALVSGRPMFVSKCESDRSIKTASFKYNTGLEKNKLFVRGLPLTMSQEDVEKFFGEYGELIAARLVTFRNGHSKGFAYLDYKDEASASLALVKTDGIEIEGKTLNVALSNPPERKPKSEEQVRSLGGGPKVQGSRGKGRTQVTLFPRAVQPLVPRSVARTSSQTNGSTNSESQKLSNADFRRMLLGNRS